MMIFVFVFVFLVSDGRWILWWMDVNMASGKKHFSGSFFGQNRKINDHFFSSCHTHTQNLSYLKIDNLKWWLRTKNTRTICLWKSDNLLFSILFDLQPTNQSINFFSLVKLNIPKRKCFIFHSSYFSRLDLSVCVCV